MLPFIALVQVVVVSLFGAVLLHLACWAFNKISRREAALQKKSVTKLQKPMPNIQNVSATAKDDKNPFAAPKNYAIDGAAVGDESPGVPMPSFLKAIAIMFTYAITGFAILFCMALAISLIEPSDGRTTLTVFNFASVFVNFCLLGVIIRYALPTTAGKAALVTVFTVTFAIVIGLVIFVPIMFVSSLGH